MKLKDVSLYRLDESEKTLPYFYRSKVITIKTDMGDFTTPSRLISRGEYTARSAVPLSRPPPLDLAVDFKNIFAKNMNEILTSNAKAKDLIRHSKSFHHQTERAKFRISIYQPSNSAFDGLGIKNRKKFLAMQADFCQLDQGNEIVTYPYWKAPFSRYKEYVDTYFREDPYSTIFVVDMGAPHAHFKKVVDYLVKKGSKMIALIYEYPEEVANNHLHIATEYADKNLAFIACQVPREYLKKKISAIHPWQFRGIDLVAPFQGRGGEVKPDLNKVNFFRVDLGFENIRTAFEHHGTIIADELDLNFSDEKDRELVRKMISGYKSGAVNSRKFERLVNLARVHETIVSSNEFEVSKGFIRNNETKHYFKMRPRLMLLNMFAQTRLNI